jgi:hypothetical protein
MNNQAVILTKKIFENEFTFKLSFEENNNYITINIFPLINKEEFVRLNNASQILETVIEEYLNMNHGKFKWVKKVNQIDTGNEWFGQFKRI